jgi:ssDNA-binding Zn-finger/Zn-ribbon topoisomerase 1
MRTFEFVINQGQASEYTFFLDAQNLHTAEAIAKVRTKRNHKAEYVATHPVKKLQSLPHVNHTDEVAANQPHTFFFECPTPKCKHLWTADSVSSIAYKERCPKCRRKHINDKPVSYQYMVDWRESYPSSDVASAA